MNKITLDDVKTWESANADPTQTIRVNPVHYLKLSDAEQREICRRVYVLELAQRIIDTDNYGAMDADATPETVAQDISNDPLEVINYLLDIIEDLQA